MKRDYEMMVILKPLLPDDIKAGIEKRLAKVLAQLDGKITSTDVWGKRHLAYNINGHEEGYYIVYNINMLAEKVNELNKELKVFNDILRYIVIQQDNQ